MNIKNTCKIFDVLQITWTTISLLITSPQYIEPKNIIASILIYILTEYPLHTTNDCWTWRLISFLIFVCQDAKFSTQFHTYPEIYLVFLYQL